MDKQYFIQLLNKYFKSNLTNEERDALENYYNLFQDDPDIFDTLDDDQKNKFKNEIKDAVWDAIRDKEKNYSRVTVMHKRKWMISAAAAAIGAIAISLFFIYPGVPEKKTIANITSEKKENRLIFLPDGSKVVLNAGSKLNYQSSFDGMEKREVFLEGQAFFDIKHNESKPFIVHTGKIQTIVLGTAFNVKAIRGDEEVTVTVTRGKVKVQDADRLLGIITPNQEIKYNRQENNLVMGIINDDHYLDWKEQDLLFDNVTLAEAVKMFEEQYKVKIIINDQSVGSSRFSATFPRKGNLEQVLKSICEFNGLNYYYDKNDTATIYLNK